MRQTMGRRSAASSGSYTSPPPRRPQRSGAGPMLLVLAAAVLLAVLAGGQGVLAALRGGAGAGVFPGGGAASSAVQPGAASSTAASVAASAAPTAAPTPDPKEEEMYRTMYKAAAAGKATVTVHGTEAQYLAAFDRLYQHAELFWLSGASYTSYSSSDKIEVTFKSRYPDPAARMAELEQTANAILQGVPAWATQYEKALYVHDWLVQNVDYVKREDKMDQGAYAALVDRRCVCNGYARGFQYLMQKLGITTGVISGVADTGERHAWNYAILDGVTTYFDVTWDDPVNNQHPEVTRREWFGLTLAEMQPTHIADAGEYVPSATSDRCNFYLRSGWQLQRYDSAAVRAIFADQLARGTGCFTLRCADDATYRQMVQALVDESGIYTVLEEIGCVVDSCSISRDERLRVIYFFV